MLWFIFIQGPRLFFCLSMMSQKYGIYLKTRNRSKFTMYMFTLDFRSFYVKGGYYVQNI